jgi:hypothetical protein
VNIQEWRAINNEMWDKYIDNIVSRINVPPQVMFVSGLRIFATWRLILERINW